MLQGDGWVFLPHCGCKGILHLGFSHSVLSIDHPPKWRRNWGPQRGWMWMEEKEEHGEEE